MTPALLVGVEHVLHRRLVRHIDRLGDGAGEEALRGAHHSNVTHVVDEARPRLATLIGAIEDRKMLLPQERRAFDGHRATDHRVRLVDLALAEPKCSQKVESGTARICGRNTSPLQRLFAQRPDVEGEAKLEDSGQGRFDLVYVSVKESAIAQRVTVDVRRAFKSHGSQDVLENSLLLFG